MSEPHAAITLSQLHRLDEFIAHRQHIAARYDAAFADGPVRPLHVPENAFCNYYKYIAFLPDGVDRAMVKKRMREEFEVGLSGEVYEMPLHLQPVFEPWAEGPLPGAEEACATHICLPVSAVMTDEQADLVIEGIKERRDELIDAATVAITGGSGFIGSNVIDALVGAGRTVRVLDPVRPHRDDVEWDPVDILDVDSLVPAVEGTDAMFHLAAMADVNDIIGRPVATPRRSTSRARSTCSRPIGGPRPAGSCSPPPCGCTAPAPRTRSTRTHSSIPTPTATST